MESKEVLLLFVLFCCLLMFVWRGRGEADKKKNEEKQKKGRKEVLEGWKGSEEKGGRVLF